MRSRGDPVAIGRSLAVRLGLLNAAFFGAGVAAVLCIIYLWLARVVENRDREALELRAARYANAYAVGGANAVRSLLDRESELPNVRSLYVRIVVRGGQVTFAKVPQEWVSEQRLVLVPDNWGGWRPERVQTVRVPRDERRDLTVVSRSLVGGALLQVARSTDNRVVLLEPLRRIMGIAGPIAVLVAAGAGAFLSWHALRPVRAVAATARRIVATGDLSAQVPDPRRDDEVGELVAQFNTLLRRNSTLLRAMRDALDNVAHDVRTPLTRLRATAEAAIAQAADPEASRAALADCIEETDRIRRLLETLLDISAAEAGVLPLQRETIAVDPLLASVAELYGLVAEEKSIRFGVVPAPGATVLADPVRIRQVLANLVDNAIKYTPAGGAVTLSAATRDKSTVIQIQDTGPGVPPEDRERIWRRLYRGDRSRSQRGLGLGLSMVKAIVEAHGGVVSVADRAGGGAVFSVELPAGEPALPPAAAVTPALHA